MKLSNIIDIFKINGIELNSVEDRMEYQKSDIEINTDGEGNKFERPPVEFLIEDNIDSIYAKVLDNPYIDYLSFRFPNNIEFKSIPFQGGESEIYLNCRIVKLTEKSCAFVGYFSGLKKDILENQ